MSELVLIDEPETSELEIQVNAVVSPPLVQPSAQCNRHKGVMITPLQQMVSSCSGALFTSVLVTPLDVVKIRLQAQKKPSAFMRGKCFLYCNGLMDHMCTCLNGGGNFSPAYQWYKKPLPVHFTGTADAFVKIVKYEGVASLWSGLPPTLVMALPATVVYFTCYEQLKAAMQYSDSCPQDWWKPMASGGTARVWAATVISPIELVRTKMQSEQLTYRAVAQSVSNTIRTQGLLSMWKGLGPTLLRDVPFSALYWLCYESMKAEVLRLRGSPELSFMESFTAGATAGTLAAVVTLPFDVIKTHRQVELGEQVLSGVKKSSSSTWVLIKKLYMREGFRAVFAGLVPRIIKVAPACAIMISTYEYCKTFFYNHNRLLELS
ncbi:mitochondrial glutathione transporter SLC25A40-like [Babylonia areolata]|uniref:mitochondrial glutathione transporter SLC25A40-like n=1 Tax=Babylonia areolata TaxID=304850 RepID=UPI003FD0A9B6